MPILRGALDRLSRAIPAHRLWTPSAILGGVATVVTLSVLGTPVPGVAALASVMVRPSVALSVLVGPTGLTFPCWATTRSPRSPPAAPLSPPAL